MDSASDPTANKPYHATLCACLGNREDYYPCAECQERARNGGTAGVIITELEPSTDTPVDQEDEDTIAGPSIPLTEDHVPPIPNCPPDYQPYHDRPTGRRVLLRTTVAGTAYHQARHALPHLRLDGQLALRREPRNPHDTNAIAIDLPAGPEVIYQLGYLPHHDNTLTAEFLDSGHPLTCHLVGAVLDDDLTDCELTVEVRWAGWPTAAGH
jgi:hypothetical protein